MQILGVNNMRPGNQGVTIYLDGMDMLTIMDGLNVLHRDMATRAYPATDPDDPVSEEDFRQHLMSVVAELHDDFVELNTYLESINPNMQDS